MLMARRFFFFFMYLLLGLSTVTAQAQNAPVSSLMPNDDLDSLRSALVVDPSEIDLGILAPGQEIKRTLRLKNAGPGNPEWFAQGPDGWTLSDGQNLSGVIGETPIPIKIHLAYV